jgi:hypothetical protein
MFLNDEYKYIFFIYLFYIMNYDNNVNLEPRLKNYLLERNFYKENNLGSCSHLKKEFGITRKDVVIMNEYIKKLKSKKEQKKLHNDIFNHTVYKTVSNGMPLYPSRLFGLSTNMDNIEDINKIQTNLFDYKNDNYCDYKNAYSTLLENRKEYNTEQLMTHIPHSTSKSFGYPNATDNYFNIVNKNSINLVTDFIDRPVPTRVNNKVYLKKYKYDRTIM